MNDLFRRYKYLQRQGLLFLQRQQEVFYAYIAPLPDRRTHQAKQKTKDEVVGFLSSQKKGLQTIFDMQNHLVVAKNMVIRKLESARGVMDTFIRTDNGYRVTPAEGFVAIDQIGNAVKLVDRMEFSRANFNAAKNWTK